MAYNFIHALDHIGDLYAEEGLCDLSEIISQATDMSTDGKMVVMYHGTTSFAAASIIKQECHQSRDGTQGTVAMSYRYVHTMNCIGDLWVGERLCNFFEEILQNTDEPTDGKIYVMYHGTTSPAAESIIKNGFTHSRDGMLGRGVYVSRNISKALCYPSFNRADQVVLKLRVNVGRVIKIDRHNHPLQKTWHDHGYDTAWVPSYCGMVNNGLQEDCVWDPKRIKVVGVAHATQTHVKQFLDSLVEQYAQ